MVIHDVSNLCDIAEAICNAQEERLNRTYFDLPIWASPRHLMASLCDDGSNVQEERLNQTYFDLPIWASPGGLVCSW
ncbi:hypothetical protein V6N13_104895 [Hibiscus sabdariffa]|uniref:Uncharacterized protein n=1 Tax=Hibiscus sabdariffa TaxID=183260 RepID=A0ABR2SIP4_9ROSI